MLHNLIISYLFPYCVCFIHPNHFFSTELFFETLYVEFHFPYFCFLFRHLNIFFVYILSKQSNLFIVIISELIQLFYHFFLDSIALFLSFSQYIFIVF